MKRKLIIDERAWNSLVHYLEEFPHTEKFLLGIGYLKEETNVIIAFVIPYQLEDSGCFCRIDTEDMSPVLFSLDILYEKYSFPHTLGVVAWPHTHPNLGLFLSGTDKATLKNWIDADPATVAIVIDVFLKDKILFKAFGAGFISVECAIEQFNELDEYRNLFFDFTARINSRLWGIHHPPEAVITPFGFWRDHPRPSLHNK